MCQQNAAKCNAMCLKVFPLDVKMAYINKVSVPVSHIVSLSNKLYPYFLVLVGSRNGFESDFTIKLK